MKMLWVFLCAVAGFAPLAANAEDPPDLIVGYSKQQLKTPDCYTAKYDTNSSGSDPCDPSVHVKWLDAITTYRNEFKAVTGYDDSRYKEPKLKWAQSSFIQPQMMVHDRYLYDPIKNKYTVDRYLDDLKKRYGGIDAVLVWPSYPVMGTDDRNQIDMAKSMPGGINGLKQMVADFHKRGVRVLFPIMPWDRGVNQPSKPWPEAVADFMKEINADGINGDTMWGVPLEYSQAAEKIGHPLAFQPEATPTDEALAWNVMTWGQYEYYFAPMVDRLKWVETRHGVNISDRWNHDKTNNLQYAFFNGVGWESWENVWGVWNGITPRDAEATRRVATIERGVSEFLVSPKWEPLYPTKRYGIFASRWPLGKQTVWTIVNRNNYSESGEQMSIPAVKGMNYYDLYRGIQIIPRLLGGNDVISFPIEAKGYAAILASPERPNAKIQQLMADMRTMTVKPLAEFSDEWKVLPQHMVTMQRTKLASVAPEGMVKVPAPNTPYTFTVHGIEPEAFDENFIRTGPGNGDGVDVQYPWEARAQRFHDKLMDSSLLGAFYMDRTPVTNAQFKKFIDQARYRPSDAGNFLKYWNNATTYPAGFDKKPVTYVSIEDARAYCSWAGKRLPHEWEWQYAAQGDDNITYPWGNSPLDQSRVPFGFSGNNLTVPPDDVDAHPAGASPFGVLDMVGNVWQWTDEFRDDHTRAAIVRGGNYYHPKVFPEGSKNWYFSQAYKNNEHNKLLLMAPSYDRSATIGFRCVQDAVD